MQARATTFHDLLAEAVHKRQEAVSISLVEGRGTVSFVPEGDGRPCPEAASMLEEAWNACDVEGGVERRPTDFQMARANGGRSPIPGELVAVRIQFSPVGAGGQEALARLLWKNAEATAAASA